MHLTLPEQHAEKHVVLARALHRHAALRDIELPAVRAAEPSLGYRTRLKWMAAHGRLGMYERGANHRVVDTPECLVASPLLAKVAATIRERVAEFGLDAVDMRETQTPEGPRVLVTLVVATKEQTPALAMLADALCARHPEVLGVAHNVRGRKNPQVLGSATSLIRGAAVVADTFGRAHVLATFGSFVQVHRGQARSIAEAVNARAAKLGAKPRVLELFGGSGAFGLELAARGMPVELVESFGPAAELAGRAAKEQGLPLTAYTDDAARFTVKAAERGERYDLVLVDPPRRGLSTELRQALAKLAPRVIAYVSCKPPTLARDLEHFAYLGFRAKELHAYDMIPQTEEVETLCFIEPATSRAIETLWADDAAAVVDRPAFVTDEEFLTLIRAALAWPPSSVPRHRFAVSGATMVRRSPCAELGLGRRALVLAKGVTTSRGEAVGLDYRRVAVVGGHSLLDIAVRGTLEAELGALAKTGHPVIGAPGCDPATARHFAEKHGLERAFVHLTACVVAGGERVESPLAGDLVSVLASLGFAWTHAPS